MSDRWFYGRRKAFFSALLWTAASGTVLGSPVLAPILTEGGILITASSQSNELEVTDSNSFIPGTPGLVTTLLQPIFLGHFPTSESVLPRGFVSSLMATDRFAGVGVSGWSLRRSASFANTEYFQTVMNIGEVLAPLVLNYKIPEIEVATLAPFGVRGPSAHAKATMTATYFRSDGTKRAEETVFEYSLFLIREFSGEGIDAHSWEMTGLGFPSFFDDGDVFGIRHPEIEGRVPLDLLDAGEYVEISYELIAEGATGGTPEVGYHAQIGDPFNIGSGGFSVSLAEPVASDVPEPTTVLLLPAGLLGVLFTKMRKRRQTSGLSRLDR